MKSSRKIVLALALALTTAPLFAAEQSPRANDESRSERTVIEVIIDILRSPGAIKY